MSGFVLDTSMTMPWFFKDEQTPVTQAVFGRLATEFVHVPALWHWETANSLLMALRRRRYPADELEINLANLSELEVVTDQVASAKILGEVFTLAREHGLTVYDASYLELALRKGLPLATLDKELIKAAKKAGVEVLGAEGPAWELREDPAAYGAKKKTRKRP